MVEGPRSIVEFDMIGTMDPLTHSLFGWSIGRALPHQRWGRWVAPLSIFSASLPDYETLFTPRADMADYLLHHRGWGHSLLGVAGASILLAAGVAALGQRFSSRFEEGQKPTFLRALTVILLCGMTHLWLDYWNTYGIRPFYPFDPNWIYGDMVFIIDGWVWMILLATILFGSHFKPPRNDPSQFQRTPIIALAVCGSLTATIVIAATAGQLVPMTFALIWFGIAAALLIVRHYLIDSPRPRIAGGIGLSILCVYVLTLTSMNRAAHQSGLQEHVQSIQAPVLDSSANPVPGVPWRYEILVESESQIHRYSMDLLAGTRRYHTPIDRNLDDPRLALHQNTKAVRAWRSFARHPVVRHDGQTLILGDARYGLSGKRPDFSAIRLEPKSK